MRKVIDLQFKLGEVSIENVEFDPRSRDEIPKLLQGFQSIYCDRQTREKVFELLEDIIPDDTDTNNGRPGMDLWKILVLGTLRLNCNWDYDKLLEIVNNHKKLREMLGHGKIDEDYTYALQTLKDNVSLFTQEVLNKIDQVVIKYGHKLVGKKEDEDLRGSCDSFVAETNVHFPTDINLLFDAARKMIMLIISLCSVLGIEGWRQGLYNIKKVKKLFRKAEKLRRSNSKDSKKKAQKEEAIMKAHQAYIDLAQAFIDRVNDTIKSISYCPPDLIAKLMELNKYIEHAERQIDQIRRRVIEGETIPHNEKVFSIFEEHTEWISKGKAGVAQELGLKVCILKDQYGFILHHRVMQNETDDKVAVLMVREAKERFPNLSSCSFDKGFHSPDNQEELKELLDKVILPRKGKLSEENKKIEYSGEFIQARHKHSAVESSINGLEKGGLDRCPDHGINGFKRYVALAVLARNIQTIGNVVQQKELKRLKRLKKAEQKQYRLAA